jgi:hypothetical protein
MRWLELTQNTGENSGFTTAQLEPVFRPLRVAISQSPPLPEVYLLLADAWLRCRDRISPSDFATLVAAAPMFRRLPGLGYRVALLHLREGQRAEARNLLVVGREFVSEAAVRAQYDKLLAALEAPANPAPAKP